MKTIITTESLTDDVKAYNALVHDLRSLTSFIATVPVTDTNSVRVIHSHVLNCINSINEHYETKNP